MYYDGIALSIDLLLLSGVLLICIIATAMPLFMNRSNVGELMPIARKGARVSAILAAICLVLELASPGSVIRDPTLDITTVALFLWALGLIYLLKHYGRRLHYNA